MAAIKIKDLMKIMDNAYHSEGTLQTLHEDENYDVGDGLIKFIYQETMDIVDPKRKGKPVSTKTITELKGAIERASNELISVLQTIILLEYKMNMEEYARLCSKKNKCSRKKK